MGGMTLCKWKNILEFYFRNRNREGRARLESKEVSEIFGLKGNVKPHDTLILMKITMLSQNFEVAASCAIPQLEVRLIITINLPRTLHRFLPDSRTPSLSSLEYLLQENFNKPSGICQESQILRRLRNKYCTFSGSLNNLVRLCLKIKGTHKRELRAEYLSSMHKSIGSIPSL